MWKVRQKGFGTKVKSDSSVLSSHNKFVDAYIIMLSTHLDSIIIKKKTTPLKIKSTYKNN